MSPVEEPCSGAQQPLERTSEVELGKGVVPPHRHDPQRCGTVCGGRAAQNSIGIEEISQQRARERETCTRVSEERGQEGVLSDFDRRFSGKTHHFVRVFLCEFGGDREKKGGGVT